MRDSIDFARINRAALARLPELLRSWLPGGWFQGAEYVVRNPTRQDRHAGSFRINSHTGRWADFATDDRGGDVVSLFAYLRDMRQVDAARQLARMLEGRNDG